MHYADAPAEGTRVYRDSPAKVKNAVATFNKSGVDFVVSLGDFKVHACFVSHTVMRLVLVATRGLVNAFLLRPQKR